MTNMELRWWARRRKPILWWRLRPERVKGKVSSQRRGGQAPPLQTVPVIQRTYGKKRGALLEKAPRRLLFRVGQKKSFNASWPMRGSAACRMAPKLFVELTFWKLVREAESSMKLARLNALKNSARNWSFQRSVNEKFLARSISQVNAPGKRKLFLPMVPNVPSMSGLFLRKNFPGFLGSGFSGSGTMEGSNASGFSQSTHDALIPAAAHAPPA